MHPERELLNKLLVETITTLCKNSLKYRLRLCVDGLIGITVDQQDVFLVKLSEIIANVNNDGVDEKDVLLETECDSNPHTVATRRTESYYKEPGEIIEGTISRRTKPSLEVDRLEVSPYDDRLSTPANTSLQTSQHVTSKQSYSKHSSTSKYPCPTPEHSKPVPNKDTLYPVVHPVPAVTHWPQAANTATDDCNETPVETGVNRVRYQLDIHNDHSHTKPDVTVIKEEVDSTDDEHEDEYLMITGEELPEQRSEVKYNMPTEASTSQNMGTIALGVWMPSATQPCVPTQGVTYPQAAAPPGGVMMSPCPTQTFTGSDLHNLQYNTRVLNYVVSTYTEEIKECPACKISFPSTKMLAKHLLIHMHDPPNSQPCPFCRLDIKSKANMNSHIKTRHLGQKYICIICGSAHTRKNVTVRHVLKLHKQIVYNQ